MTSLLRSTGQFLLCALAFAAWTIAVPSDAVAGERDRARAQESHPEAAAALDGLLAEMTVLEMMVRGCSDRVCEQLRVNADEMGSQLAGLWPVVAAPTGKREQIDAVYRSLDQPNAYLDAYLPQADLPELDALMREWTATKERIDRFKRTLRLLADA